MQGADTPLFPQDACRLPHGPLTHMRPKVFQAELQIRKFLLGPDPQFLEGQILKVLLPKIFKSMIITLIISGRVDILFGSGSSISRRSNPESIIVVISS